MIFGAIEKLCGELHSLGHTITVETAGTVFRRFACDLMSISPKLANSTPPRGSGWAERHEATRLNLPVLAELIETYNHQLKFVVGDDVAGDVVQIRELLGKLPPVVPDRVLLMPQGTDSEALHRRARNLVNVCVEHGWRLCPRLHIDLFGNKRGT